MQSTIPLSTLLPTAALILLALATFGDAYPRYPYGGGGGQGYASVHSGDDGGLYDTIQPGPARLLTFPGTIPVAPKCGNAVLLKCNKEVKRVQCVPGGRGYGGHLGGHAASTGAYGGGYAAPSHGGSY